QHWRSEIVAFQQNASRRFAPSMRQRLDVARLYADALEQLDGLIYDGAEALPWPAQCLWSLDDLLTDRRDSLLQRLVDASGTGPK
ncbi:MAG TPA: DUF29 family protein, partial [Stellaceae bacterium]|nr:DUF29 family protein [Stellaceae bacterium]